MRRSVLFLFAFLLFMASPALAERYTVTGNVIDDEERLPLPGVTVMIKGTTVGTTTDIDGNYSLEVNSQDTLSFTFIGYQELEVLVDGREIIDVTLQTSAIVLDDVVVVGYGVQTRASMVASIAQTSGEDLLQAGEVTSVSQALQGMLPGITAVSSTSKPGADHAELFIRGRASWQSTDPLVLVDGIERDMNDVDPNEIESVSVLKDASATAVYGVKGANGVILITTKRGEVAPPSISFSTNLGFKAPTASPEFADYVTAMEMRNESLANDLRWNEQVPDAVIETWRQNMHKAGPYNDYFPHVDWWDLLVRDVGYQYRFNVNVRGGTDFMRYFASVSYLNDGDIFETTPSDFYDPSFAYDRYNFRSNFDFNVTRTTELSLNLSGMVAYRNQTGYRINPGSGGQQEDGFGQAQFFQGLYQAPQNEFPIQWSDGEWAVGPDGDYRSNLYASFNEMGQRIYRYYRGFADLSLDQDLEFITEGLSFNATVSFNSRSAHTSSIQRYGGGNFGEQYPITYSRRFDLTQPMEDGSFPMIEERRWPFAEAQNPPPSASYDNLLVGGFGRNFYYEAALNFDRSFGRHNLTALGLFSRSADEGLMGDHSVLIKIPERREDYVGRLTYNWAERYLFEFNAAYNGSEKFAPGMRYGFFPSVSVGWRVSEEPFIKERLGHFLDNLRIRASFGSSGVDRGARRFSYIQPYNTGGGVSLGYESSNWYGPLFTEGAAANPNATWETSTKQNLGFNIGLFQRLELEVDFFREQRTGILMGVWSPLWLGIAEASGNVGETKNQGAEIELDWRDRIGPNFRYRVALGVAFNENRIVYRGDGLNMAEYLQHAGKPIGWQTGLEKHGYYESLDDIFNYATPGSHGVQSGLVPGDFMFIDFNGDGLIDDQDRVAMQNVDYPLNTYSLTLAFGYGAFDINMMFYAVSDLSKRVDGLILWDLHRGDFGIYKAGPDVLGRWTPENAENAIKPALHASGELSSYSQSASSFVYQDASYIRLKNLEISYNINNPDRIGLNRLQIYVNGNNLLTWTSLDSRMDPETQSAGVYPLVKRYNLGIRASL